MVERRGGFALMELVIGASLLLLVVQTSWWIVGVHAKAATSVVDGTRSLDAVRVTRHVVTSEIGEAGSPEDFEVIDSEIRLRAFRGVAVFCDGTDDVWWVNAAGVRDLDPGKDSVALFEAGAGWRFTAVQGRTLSYDDECPAVRGFHEERWVLAEDADAPVAGRYFERGAYRFINGAFRTLQGRGGWQPITEAELDDRQSGIWARGSGGVFTMFHWKASGPAPDQISWASWATW